MLCFSVICGWAGSKSNLGSTAGAEVAVERRNEKWQAAGGEKHIFNQNAPLATCSDHFLKLRCGKIARRCSERRVFNQNVPPATC